MSAILQILGTVIVLLALADVFLTVLHPRAESSVLSIPLAGGVWWLFRSVTRKMKRRDRILSYGGPTIILAIIGMWVILLLLGFALVVWPALGSEIQMTQGETPTGFGTALYYAGFSITTLGTGDLVPKTEFYRLLIVLKSIVGFSVLTLTLSYVTSVYSNLTNRNTFALNLHHRTADTADSTELLARLAADNNVNTLHQDISDIAQSLIHLLEATNSYPVLFYFRYRQPYYALSRIIYLAMDTVTLIKSALDQDEYRSVTHSSGVAELWFGGKHLLEELGRTLLPGARVASKELNEDLWRSHYFQALERLKTEGIKTVINPEAGAQMYADLRNEWAPYLVQLERYMGYEPINISPAEYR